MPKRKRDEQGGADRSNGKPSVEERLSLKVFHCRRVLQRSLKLAKGFERQKLGRRRKTALQTNTENDVKRIDGEIEALKILDLAIVAEVHLARIVARDKVLNHSEILSNLSRPDAQFGRDAASANVTARLYNSNAVKEAALEVITSLQSALGVKPRPAPGSKPAAKPVAPINDVGEEEAETDTLFSSEDEELAASSQGSSTAGVDPGKGFPPPRVAEHRGIDFDDEQDLVELENQMVGSDSDSGDQLSVQAEAARPPLLYNDADMLSLSPSPTLSGSSSPRPQSPKRADPTRSAKGNSAFLPSLTMGGYWSVSEEEASDLDADKSGAMAPRKNRRGQRARQQIWEKKFGSKAKHVQKDGQGSRDVGWDPKRGATESSSGSGYRPGWARSKPKGPSEMASGGNAVKVGPRKIKPGAAKKGEKPLHPSWEAAKKAKERKGANAPAFAGSKMVFD